MKHILIFAIDFYRAAISPIFPSCCRFYPTCSSYFKQAVYDHGIIKGGFLGLKRVLKCVPGGRFGYDPPPKKF